MVQLTRIYTRGGDAGETSLGSGERVAKYDARVAAYGTVDEANAVIGIARLHTADNPDIDAMLARIQNDLFDLGADLCTPQDDARSASKPEGALRVVAAQVERLETEIDAINENLAPLNWRRSMVGRRPVSMIYGSRQRLRSRLNGLRSRSISNQEKSSPMRESSQKNRQTLPSAPWMEIQ